MTRNRRTIAGVALAAVAATTLAVSTGSGASPAGGRTIIGDDRANDLYGTSRGDRIEGRGGNDDLYGRADNDTLLPGPGVDDVYGGPGNDTIDAVDGIEDDIWCGSGVDTVRADPIDDVHRSCENVQRVGGTGGATTSPGASVTADEAARIAVAHVGGRLDDVEPTRDHGAAWEVDVYAPDGEYTIYVAADGRIVRVEGPFRWD